LSTLQASTASITVTLPEAAYVTQHKSPAYRHEQEFRRQLMDSVPVKDWGYKIQEIRFSGDSHKALVVCLEPGKSEVREFTLEDDGFRRFTGHATIFDTDKTPNFQNPLVIVTLPNK
jgi:hypothetical protein